jgi:hypothetical protein
LPDGERRAKDYVERLIACCATAVALSRIDYGNGGFELTSVSHERELFAKKIADVKDISFENDAYNLFQNYIAYSSYPSICRTPRHPLSPCSPLPAVECTLLYEALDAVAFLYTYFLGFLISFIRTWSIGVTFAASKGSSDE